MEQRRRAILELDDAPGELCVASQPGCGGDHVGAKVLAGLHDVDIAVGQLGRNVADNAEHVGVAIVQLGHQLAGDDSITKERAVAGQFQHVQQAVRQRQNAALGRAGGEGAFGVAEAGLRAVTQRHIRAVVDHGARHGPTVAAETELEFVDAVEAVGEFDVAVLTSGQLAPGDAGVELQRRACADESGE